MRLAGFTTVIFCTIAACAGALLFTPAAFASRDQIDFFEAPQQLLNYGARPAAIAQLQSLGVHAVRIQLIWYEVAPSPRSKKKPSLNLANPASYNWGQYLPLIQQLHHQVGRGLGQPHVAPPPTQHDHPFVVIIYSHWLRLWFIVVRVLTKRRKP